MMKTGARSVMSVSAAIAIAVAGLAAVPLVAQQNPFPGGTNPDGSLRPSPPVTRLFTQDAYTEYALLEPGSESFRIRFLPEETRAGAKEIVNATRGGSAGSDIEVFDPRSGQPIKFTYEQSPQNPDDHAIRAPLPIPVPEGGIGRVLILKTYKDPRTYMMHGDDIVWVRALSGYRLGVLLPKGFAFISSNVAAQLATSPEGRLKLAFANPSGQSNPVTIHARRTTAAFAAPAGTPAGAPAAGTDDAPDVFFDDVKTLYDLGAPETGSIRVEQTYTDYRKGDSAALDSLSYLQLTDLSVIDLDTAKKLTPVKVSGNSGGKGGGRGGTAVKLEVPIVKDTQSAHLRIAGALADKSYRLDPKDAGALVFDRTLRGLRNTVLLPEGWDVSAVSQSATIGTYQGRAFVALINLNAENTYRVVIRARKR
jgi:hypothetical protein